MPCVTCTFTVREFLHLSSNRRQLIDFLVDHGVLCRFSTCVTCDNIIELNINSLFYTCSKTYRRQNRIRKCKTKKNAKKGTWFSKAHLSLEDIVYFVVLWLRLPFPRQNFIMRELHCSSKTVVDWSSFCRELCVQWVVEHSDKIGGIGKIVEIDEAKFGRRKYNRGRSIEGQWVFGGIDRESRKVFFVPVPDRTAQTLLNVIKQWILPGTTIISDCWRAYDNLEREGFNHLAVNHSLHFVDPNDSNIHTQNIERIWRNVRGAIPRYGRKQHHFIGYLAEFLFKNANQDNCDIHQIFLQIAKLYPPQV